MNKYEDIKIASIMGIIGNLFLLVIKGIIGFITNSQSMIADTLNSGGDILSSLITYIGNKISSKPSDKDHNLGHGKAEYIYSMLISVVMLIAVFSIIKSAIITLYFGNKYDFSIWLIIVCIITIITKFLLYLYTNITAKKYDNILMKANSRDHLNDMFITSLTLISGFFNYINIYFIDGIFAIVIGLWMVYTAIKIFVESYDVLMDKSISLETQKKVYKLIKNNSSIKRVEKFCSTPIGYNYQISLNIYVDGNLSTFESHKIADDLEKEILTNFKEIYLVVIHVNPE